MERIDAHNVQSQRSLAHYTSWNLRFTFNLPVGCQNFLLSSPPSPPRPHGRAHARTHALSYDLQLQGRQPTGDLFNTEYYHSHTTTALYIRLNPPASRMYYDCTKAPTPPTLCPFPFLQVTSLSQETVSLERYPDPCELGRRTAHAHTWPLVREGPLLTLQTRKDSSKDVVTFGRSLFGNPKGAPV